MCPTDVLCTVKEVLSLTDCSSIEMKTAGIPHVVFPSVSVMSLF